jgi:hypothetical protein
MYSLRDFRGRDVSFVHAEGQFDSQIRRRVERTGATLTI